MNPHYFVLLWYSSFPTLLLCLQLIWKVVETKALFLMRPTLNKLSLCIKLA